MDHAPSMSDADLEQAISGSWGPVLRVVGRPKLAGDAPSESVMLAVQGLARDPLCLQRGEFFTTIERLGLSWSNALLEYVVQVPPYNGRDTAFDAWATLKNISDLPVKVISRVRIRQMAKTTGRISSDGWSEVANTHNHVVGAEVLDPGKTIELPAERAIHMLRRHSWEARSPQAQSLTSQFASEFPLREVAYRCRWVDYETGEEHTVDSREALAVGEKSERRRASA